MLQFGYAQEDITPVRGIALCGYFNPRPNKGMLDPLKVKAAVFSVNKNIAGIVSYDLCFIPKALVNRFISALKDAGITFADKIIFCATHTHTGPYTTKCFDDMSDAAYLDALVAKTVYAVKNAFASLAPAEIQATVTECTTQAYNRRFWMKDGSVLTNPGKLNPNIDRPEGAMDPEIPIIAIKQEGQLRALIVNIVNHTDTIGGDFISADWPGRMEHAIQSELGYDIPVITIVGAQGNINHFNVKTAVDQTSYQEAIRIGKAYASVILSALYQLNTIAIDKIRVASEEFEVPYRQVSDEDYAEAKKIIEANKDAVMEEGRDFTSEDIAKKHPYVMKFFAQMLADCRDKAITEKRIETMMTMQFGDQIGIVSLPCEPFVELGLGNKAVSPFPFTIIAGLAMGETGYVGLKENYCHGNAAYETSPSPDSVDVNVGEDMLARGKRLIQKLAD